MRFFISKRIYIVFLGLCVINIMLGAASSSDSGKLGLPDGNVLQGSVLNQNADIPAYVEQLKMQLRGVKKLSTYAYKLEAVPEMDKTWQKVVLAGYPESVTSIFTEFKQRINNGEGLQGLNKFYLLHGEPGVGKTSAARVLALSLNRPLLHVSCPLLETKHLGSIIKNLEKIWDPILNSFDPWVVCLDDVDALQRSLMETLGACSSHHRSNALTGLQQILDNSKNPNLIVIGTSNYEQGVEKNVVARSIRGAIYVPLPNYVARKQIAKLYLKQKGVGYTNELLDFIAYETGGCFPTLTPGFSERGIKHVVEGMLRIRRQAGTGISAAKYAIDEIKKAYSDAGHPITAEGRWLNEQVRSQDFWPAVDTGLSLGTRILATIVGARHMMDS